MIQKTKVELEYEIIESPQFSESVELALRSPSFRRN